MTYYLYPPFFIIEPESSFDDAWEAFCCEFLNLENHTNTIRRRRPPDLGCDLIWEEQKVAYQCKAVENSRSGQLNSNKVRESIETAKKNKDTVGWVRYVLCTNVNLTGKQEQKIRMMLPEIEFFTLNYWIALCKKFPSVADTRFHRLISIPQHIVTQAINRFDFQEYARKLQERLDTTSLVLLVYSNIRKVLFELHVSLEFTIEDVIEILIEVFQLPSSKNYKDIGINVSLRYSLVINDEQVPIEKKLSELLLPWNEKPLVYFWKTIVWSDTTGRQTTLHEMELITMESITKRSLSSRDRSQIAIERYKQEINAAFDRAIANFRSK